MPRLKTNEEALDGCLADGLIQDREEADIAKIRSTFLLAKTMLDVASDVKKGLDRKSPRWSIVYAMHYDGVWDLSDIIARFDRKRIPNHQCLFAWVCAKHDLLEWNFCEQIRTKRNGIHYYGEPATYDDWKKVEFGMQAAIKTLTEEIEKKIGEHS